MIGPQQIPKALHSILGFALLVLQLSCVGTESTQSSGGIVPSSANTAPQFKPGFNLFSPQQDVEMGKQSAAQIVHEMPLLRDAQIVGYIQQLGAKLAAKAPGEKFPYSFSVIGTKDVNAFALPGGFIFVNAAGAVGVTFRGRSSREKRREQDMQQRRLGTEGLEVASIGLGCMGMSEFYGATDEAESIATLHRALDLGVNFFDTSDMYGPYKNEELLAKALRGRRNDCVIATKFGIRRGPDPTQRWIDGNPEYVRQACDGSLKRLGVDHIDLYYQHRVDSKVPIEDTVGAMSDLVKAGKVLYLGLSEAGPQTIRRANAVHAISALQSEYSLWSRDPEDEIFATTRELGIGFVAYSPLGRGFLTGQFKKFDDLDTDDYRRHSPRFQGENFDKNLALVGRVTEMAVERNATPGQLALAWVLARGGDIVPIPGTKRRSYLEENVAADEIKLSQEDMSRLEELVPRGSAAGLRYPEAMMRVVNL